MQPSATLFFLLTIWVCARPTRGRVSYVVMNKGSVLAQTAVVYFALVDHIQKHGV